MGWWKAGDGSATMEILVLGAVEAVRDGVPLRLGGPKQRAVLALLTAAVGRRVNVDQLIAGVYGGEPSTGARRTIQTYVSNLRRDLGDVLHGSGDGYVLDLVPSALDAGRFEAAYQAALREVDQEPERAAARLLEALELWRGHPYADVEAYGALDAEVARLEELRLSAMEVRIECELSLGRHREVLGELEVLVAQHPYRETLRAHQVLALYRSRRQHDALAALRDTRRTLDEELGIDPSPQLQVLERRILAQDQALELEAGPRVERRAVLVAELDAERWSTEQRSAALERRDEILAAFVAHGDAQVLGLRGTAIFAALPDIGAASRAAAGLAVLGTEACLRVALDHGDVEVRDLAVTGPPVNRAARIVALAHPGQVLMSPDAHQALTTSEVAGWGVTSLGRHPVVGVEQPINLFQLHGGGLQERFPPLLAGRVPPAVPSSAPATVPGYELRTQLGADGVSVVHRAYQASVGREVVVRAIRREVAADPAFIRRFEAEGQRVARLTHPQALPLLDYWRDPDGAYLVHPLVQGTDLRRWVTHGAVTRERRLDALAQIAATLAHAHARGVVHGRLHPGNVLVTEDDNLYVTDLGLSQMCEGFLASRAPAYAAPESLGGGGTTVAADVYALGVLAFELLEGGRPPPPDEPLPLPTSKIGALLARATHVDPSERYGTVSTFISDLRSATTGGPAVPRSLTPARNPYRGLEPFQETDAADFHGRETLVTELVSALTDERLVTVVGPSGIGKSSVVRAGLIPALRAGAVEGSERWLISDLFPGARPLEELAAALRRVAVDVVDDLTHQLGSGPDAFLRCVRRMLPADSELLLVIDQFEELFTHVVDEGTRRMFLELLVEAVTAAGSPVRIVMTLRADFFDRPLHHASFAEVMRRGVVSVRAPSRDELVRAVREPAMGVGVEVEDRLVDRLVQDAAGEPGALPLLQYVLAEGFATRDVDQLSLESYETSGGLKGAIGRRTEELYLALGWGQRDAARDVFLRLVTVDESDEDTRRRVPLTELSRLGFDEGDLQAVLTTFGRARLLTFDRDPVTRDPTVEVAHEALITDWERLRGWIDAVRDDLLVRRRITSSVREWEEAGRDPSFLLRGGRLEAAERWQGAAGLPLTDEEAAYLTLSRRSAHAEAARTRRRRRRTVAALASALIATLLFSLVAVDQRGAAVAQERLTRARQLGGEALLAIDGDPERGILLALEAMGTHRDDRGRPLPEAVSALQTALQASRVELHVPEGELVAAVSPDGRMLATDSFRDTNSVRVVDLASGAPVTRLEGAGEVGGAAFSPDGTTLAVSYEDTEGRPAVELFDVGTWQRTATFEGPPAPYGQVAFTDDGGSSLVAQGEGVGLTGWDLASGDPVEFDAPSAVDFATVSGSPTIAVTERAEEVRFVDARDGRTVEVLPTAGVTGVAVAVDATGSRVAVTSRGDRREVAVLDRATGERLASFPNPSANGVAFSPDGRLAHSSNDGTVRIVGIGDEQEELVLAGHSDGVTSIAFTADGRRLVSVSWADETRIWDVTTTGPDELGNVPIGEGRAWGVVPSPEGDRIAITVDLPADSQRVVTVDPSTGSSTIRIDGLWRAIHHMAHVSRDLSTVAALDPDHRASVDDLSTGEPQLQLPPCLSPRGISPDGSRLVVDGRLLCTITKQSDRIVADPPADAVLRSAVVDARTGTVLRDLGERPISWAVLGPPGTPFERYAVVVVGFVEIELHDLENDTLVGSLDLSDEAILTLGGSDDGRHVVLNAQSGRAFVLDLLAAEAGASLEDAVVRTVLDPAGGPLIHSDVVGGLLATSTMAGHVRVLDLDGGSLLVDLEVDATGPAPIGFTEGGAQLYYTDGAVLRRFEVDPDRLVALARSRLTRGFTVEECEQYGIESDPCHDVRSR
jgi:DNA-binding SARP family transcriptional activator/dipeptidyl aminopeptidase/acylaminoacyl peptidase